MANGHVRVAAQDERHGLTKAGVPFAARLEPYRHCRILSSKPETRPWLYENLRKYLKGNEAK